MLTHRVIPCLDVRGGRVVKGVRFRDLRDCGEPAAAAARYAGQGADEIVLLDVSATVEERAAAADTVRAVRAAVDVPLCVGGGVRGIADAEALLAAGADKVAVNSAAVRDPALLGELAGRFGRQCVVLALDARRQADGTFAVFTHAATGSTGRHAAGWAAAAVAHGAGEILLTSIDRDGTGQGYDLELLAAVRAAVAVPVIASGGAASPTHLRDALAAGADAVLVASLLHDDVTTVAALKTFLADAGFPIRP